MTGFKKVQDSCLIKNINNKETSLLKFELNCNLLTSLRDCCCYLVKTMQGGHDLIIYETMWLPTVKTVHLITKISFTVCGYSKTHKLDRDENIRHPYSS